MKRFILTIVGFLSLISASYSQNGNSGYYYANGIRHYWQEDHTSAIIIGKNVMHYDSIASNLLLLFNNPDDEIVTYSNDNRFIINSSSLETMSAESILGTTSVMTEDNAYLSYAKIVDGNRIWLTNEVFVMLKDSVYYTTFMQPIISQYQDVAVYPEGSNMYRLVCNTEEQVVTLANSLYDTIYVDYSTPDFYSDVQLNTNDPFYTQQWNLKNIGQQGGTIGVDIKAEEAWAFVQRLSGHIGSNLKVAIVDPGVEAHEDLTDGNGNSRVLSGYTADGSGTGAPISTSNYPRLNAHGECCAGIVAASQNNIGIAGISPLARIVPIKIFNAFDYPYTNAQIASAIRKAWDTFQTPVLSNSWGGGTPNDVLTSAINYVATNGRNGKGCFVVFASGNDYSSSVSYPSVLENVMAVGAVNRNGSRINYSNYGSALDIVAPSDPIVTTDRMGTYGYDNGNYYNSFNGTSAACPHVAGVAALMLSVNPNLTRAQMMDIIERTAQKVGGYSYQMQNNDPEMTWNVQVGYGLIDAHKSVVNSFLFGQDISLTGPSELFWSPCDKNEYSLSITHPDLFTYVWSCSSNMFIASSNQNHVNVIANGTGSGYIRVQLFSEGRLIKTYSKNVSISQQYNTITTANITTNTTWAANNYYLNGDVFVEPGATLTITGTVYCSEQACIKVKPDGKLVVDGGHLLSLCDGEQWEGIQVWGNRNKHQLKENGHYWQGIAELKNNAIIENAKIAINLWNPTAVDSTNTSGGIVFASNTRFINNAKAVSFKPYENKFQHPQHPEQTVVRDNVSFFTDCLFEVNSDYAGPNEFISHVGLHKVRGVKFKACDFRLEDNAYNYEWPMGIHGYDAGFSVDGSYDYHTNGTVSIRKRSTFDNFLKAVVSTKPNSVGSRTFTVKATDFTNNQYSVFALNSGFGTVLNSNFEIGQRRYGCPAGIYAELTPQFTIEQDTFTMAEVHPEEYYGIIIKNSKSVNQIYGNVFKNLYCGNVAIDVNEINRFEGLTYRCNENYNNKCDFYVSSENPNTLGSNGIQQDQGMAGETANNTFSQPSPGNNPRHIYNDGDHPINYYYNSSQNNATPMFIYNVTRIDTIDTIGCPIHYAFSGISSDTVKPVIPQYERQLLENEYYNSYSIYNTLKSVYDNRIDGGNTSGTIANIENAQPGDMWTLRAQLLGLSPYLSGRVLRTTIDRDDVFPKSVLFEILAANPEELKNNSIINYLQDMEHPMPDYMVEILLQIANGASSRSVIESQMAKYKHAYTLAAGDIVRSLLNDTEVNLTELRSWLGNMNDINADHDIISIYMEEGNFTDAMALANMLPSLYGLTGNDLLDHYDYIRLLTLYQTLEQDGRTTFQLTPTEKELVEDVVDNGYGTAAIMAQSIMESVYGINEFTCPQVDFSKGDRGMTFSYSNEDLSKAMGLTCSTSPNPATTWVNVDFTLPSNADRATLIVSNALGIKVAEYELAGNTGQKVLDLRALANGVYTCTLICGKYQCTNKLVITK